MTRSREPRPSRRVRATEKLRYWYQATPAGIEDDWSDATSRAVIPEGAVERFRAEHPEVSAKGARRVERALLQWVRIEGRSPGAHELPSHAVEALWRSLRSNQDDWEIFRDSLGLELHPGLDALTHWVPDDDSEPMRATWSDAFDDELPFAGFPALFIVDGEVKIADVPIDLQKQDTAASPETFVLYEPAKATAEPVRGRPAPQPRWEAPPLESPAQVEAAVARLAPATPSLRADGLPAILRERRQRHRRSLLDGWTVLAANTTMPVVVAEHFTEKFPEVDAGRVTLVWDAFLQWLRIQGRKYPAQHAMPAHSVEMVLRMLRADRKARNGVRKQWPVNLDHLFVNLGRLWTPGDALAPLQATWSDAFYDEPPKSKIPLLFHVDADIGIRDARTYQAFCKRDNCEPPRGVICLHTPYVPGPTGQGGGGFG